MFVARYENTMRNARPKLSAGDDGVIRTTVDEMRRDRRMAEAANIANREAAVRRMKRNALDMMIAANMRLMDQYIAPQHRITVAEIMRRACRVFRIGMREIISARRSRRAVFARQFVMYWARRRTLLATTTIGRLLGDRDHTTVIHGSRAYVQKRASMGRRLREPA